MRVNAAVAVAVFSVAAAARADLSVVLPAAYDNGTGYDHGQPSYFYDLPPVGIAVNDAGRAVSSAMWHESYTGTHTDGLWLSGTGATGALGTAPTDAGRAYYYTPLAINSSGVAVGQGSSFSPSGTSQGTVAVRWDAEGALTPLGTLGVNASGVGSALAYGVNNLGNAVGQSLKYDGGTAYGVRAVRWDAGSATPIELGNLGTDANGSIQSARAYAINDSNFAVGSIAKYPPGNKFKGTRAIRWDADGTAHEMGNLGGVNGATTAAAYAVNSSGTSVGIAVKYVDGVSFGYRAVQWDSSGTITEMGHLGVSSSTGGTQAFAYAVNEAGQSAGSAYTWSGSMYMGRRAVRWDAQGNATPLGTIGIVRPDATYNSYAYAINNAGTVAGYADYWNGYNDGSHATLWLPDGTAFDINDLKPIAAAPGDKIILQQALSISDTGWVAGYAIYFPYNDSYYYRPWLARVGLGGNWLNTTGGNNTWGKGVNWSSGTPAVQLDAAFTTNAAYTVSLDANETCRAMSVSAGHVTLAQNSHALSVSNGLSIAAGATLAADGTLNAAVVNAGTFVPGRSPAAASTAASLTGPADRALSSGPGAATVINGSYTQTGGDLRFNVDSTEPLCKLTINGDVYLDGTVTVLLADGYSPTPGTTIDLLDWSGAMSVGLLQYDFSNAGLPAGMLWDTSSFLIDGTLSVTPEPSSVALLLAGTVGLALRPRRRPGR